MNKMLLIACAVCCVSIAHAQNEYGRIYGGAGAIPLYTEGMEDVHVSDWQNYGTGSVEGRVHLPLSAAADGYLRTGFMIGYEFDALAVPIIGEIHAAPLGDIQAYQYMLGIKWPVIENGDFRLSLVPKVGYAMATIDFGVVELIAGKTPPVITPEGTFNVGDSISTEMRGVMLLGSVVLDYAITEKLGIELNAGWNHSFIGDLEIRAGDVVLNDSSPTVVEPELGSTAQAAIEPQATIGGPVFFVGMTYRL